MVKTSDTRTTTAATPAARTPFFQKGPGQAMEQHTDTPFFVQQKLVIGQRDDPYEREADAVADKVITQEKSPAPAAPEAAPPAISRLTTPAAPSAPVITDVQAKEETEEKEPELTPVQRRSTKADANNDNPLQRKEEPEQKEPEPLLQKKAIENHLQRKEEPEQKEPEAAPVKRFETGIGTEMPGVKEKELEDKTALPLQRKPIFESNAPENTLLQRKATGPAPAAVPLQSRLSASKGGGAPLDTGTQHSMQSSMGADFSQVRIHTGTPAAQMSQDIHAQAFTHGKDIYFNEGKYNPQSPAGKHLLAHELTHTVQQGAVVRRDNNTSTQPPAHRDAAALNNQQLLDEITSTTTSLAQQDDAANQAYLQQLNAEKTVRVQAGQTWLSDPDAGTMSMQLYQLAIKDDLAGVAAVTADKVTTAGRDQQLGSSRVMTMRQLQEALAGYNNTAIAAVTTAAAMVPGMNIQLVPPEMITIYHGTDSAGEASLRQNGINVSHSTGANQDMGPGLYGSKDPAVGELYGVDRAARRGGTGTGTNMSFTVPRDSLGTFVDVSPGGQHAAQFETFLNSPLTQAEPALGQSPIFKNMTVRQYIMGLGMERRGTMFDIFLKQINIPQPGVIMGPLGGESPFTGVAPPGGSTQMVIRSQAAADVLNESMRGTLATPEGTTSMPSMRSSAAMGGAVGGTVAVVIDGVMMLIDTREHPNWQMELGKAGLLGTGGGVLGGMADTAIASAVINRGGTAIVGRLAGSAGAGTIIAPIVVMTSMAMDDQHHSGAEYAGKGTRAAVAGGMSGLVSAGVVGAIWGSEVPIMGNIVGFGIGVGVYLLIDAVAGDAVESTVEGAVQ